MLRRFGMLAMPHDSANGRAGNTHTPYSRNAAGPLFAGHYARSTRAHIDLGPLCRFSQCPALPTARRSQLDLAAQAVHCRPPTWSNTMSSIVQHRLRPARRRTFPAPPLTVVAGKADRPVNGALAIPGRAGVLAFAITACGSASVGAGAGGVEILLAAQYRLRQELHARGWTDDHIA